MQRSGFFPAGSQPVPFEQRHAQISALRKVLDDGWRRATIAIGVKYDRQIDSNIERGSVRPRDGGHLLTGIATGRLVKFPSLGCGRNGDMPGFMEYITRICQPGFVNEQNPVADHQAGKKSLLGKNSGGCFQSNA